MPNFKKRDERQVLYFCSWVIIFLSSNVLVALTTGSCTRNVAGNVPYTLSQCGHLIFVRHVGIFQASDWHSCSYDLGIDLELFSLYQFVCTLIDYSRLVRFLGNVEPVLVMVQSCGYNAKDAWALVYSRGMISNIQHGGCSH